MTAALNGLPMFRYTEDIEPPKIISAKMIDNNHIKIKFNEKIIWKRISINNFTIFDSTTSINPSYIFSNDNKEITLVFTSVKLFNGELSVSAKNIYDNSGNLLKYDNISLENKPIKDTIPPQILTVTSQIGNEKWIFKPNNKDNIYDAIETIL